MAYFLWVCACEFPSPQKAEVLESLQLRLQGVENCWIWVLGIELGPSARQCVLLPAEPSLQRDVHFV